MDTPEERRDAAISAAVTVGASVLTVTPMASPASPDVVAAYRVTFGASDLDVLTALNAVRAETEIDVHGLVPWNPVEVDDVPFHES